LLKVVIGLYNVRSKIEHWATENTKLSYSLSPAILLAAGRLRPMLCTFKMAFNSDIV